MSILNTPIHKVSYQESSSTESLSSKRSCSLCDRQCAKLPRSKLDLFVHQIKKIVSLCISPPLRESSESFMPLTLKDQGNKSSPSTTAEGRVSGIPLSSTGTEVGATWQRRGQRQSPKDVCLIFQHFSTVLLLVLWYNWSKARLARAWSQYQLVNPELVLVGKVMHYMCTTKTALVQTGLPCFLDIVWDSLWVFKVKEEEKEKETAEWRESLREHFREPMQCEVRERSLGARCGSI